MNLRILLAAILFPCALSAQIYGFNRQSITTIENYKVKATDTWYTPIEVEITTTQVVLRRPSNGAGEQPITDTYLIKSVSKNKTYCKIVTKDDRSILIYNDEYITMATKEIKGARKEYFFYNQKN